MRERVKEFRGTFKSPEDFWNHYYAHFFTFTYQNYAINQREAIHNRATCGHPARQNKRASKVPTMKGPGLHQETGTLDGDPNT